MQSVRLAVPELYRPPPPPPGGVAAEGAVGQVGRAGIEHAAAIAAETVVARMSRWTACVRDGGVAADGAVGERRRAVVQPDRRHCRRWTEPPEMVRPESEAVTPLSI